MGIEQLTVHAIKHVGLLNLLSQDAFSAVKMVKKNTLAVGDLPGHCWGSLQHSPDPQAGLRGAGEKNGKEGEERRKWEGDEGQRCGRGKIGGMKEGEKDRKGRKREEGKRRVCPWLQLLDLPAAAAVLCSVVFVKFMEQLLQHTPASPSCSIVFHFAVCVR